MGVVEWLQGVNGMILVGVFAILLWETGAVIGACLRQPGQPLSERLRATAWVAVPAAGLLLVLGWGLLRPGATVLRSPGLEAAEASERASVSSPGSGNR